ncbi:ribonuclease HI family protein [Brooklawnia cerclae]|uniref:Ribonuclease H n=1 Tax=Brooklawnia cerclae TaxID=349934 RepID=A0ABX0SC23_9ACTN|nr:ribonuclease HI family protein [Brooklawnia cerclae]NIH55932.1 ribonuclease HI [Brooklawnia cerclae]
MILAAADGSSLSNPGPAGWAWYIDDDRWAAGGWPSGTNNMGELKAVLDLLEQTAVAADEPLKILCDSQYVINSVTRWMPSWKRKGWKKADGKPVLNQDLLKAIDAALTGRDVSFEWVKGHAGHRMNEAADVRARAVATAYQKGTTPDLGPGFSRRPGDAAAPRTPEPAATAQPAPASGTSRVDADLALVVDLEKALLTDAVRTDPGRLRQLLHPEFTEFGASGRIWTRNRLLAETGPLPVRLAFEPIGTERLADDVILLRWRAVGAHGTWLRSSVWQRVEGSWRCRFAQGTPVPPER